MLIVLIIITILIIILFVLSAISIATDNDNEFMTSWEKCNGNCKSCKDKEQCMNRPYEGE